LEFGVGTGVVAEDDRVMMRTPSRRSCDELGEDEPASSL
jgi:hypothetical protein